MRRPDLPYLQRVRGGGREYWYFRRGGRRWRLPAPDDPGFLSAYQRLLDDAPRRVEALPGSMEALVISYRQSPEYRALRSSTRRSVDYYLQRIVDEHGRKPAAGLTRGRVIAIRDAMADQPGTANRYLSMLSVLMRRAMDLDWRADNPVAGVPRLAIGAYRPWPADLIARAMEQASPMMRLAIATLYYSGQRVSDAVHIRRADVEAGRVTITQRKTGARVTIPVHRAWAQELRRIPPSPRAITLLYGRSGRPLTTDALQDAWRRLRRRLGADGYHLHGLRKNACCALAEAGCSPHEISAITGQSLEMVAHYTREADTVHLASTAIRRWERGGR